MTGVLAVFRDDLRGKEYIAARGLSPEIVKNQQHTCDTCRQQELLPAVQRLIKNWKKPKGRRK